MLNFTEPLAVDAMYGVDVAAARRRDRLPRQFTRHERLSVKMHVAAALHHSAHRGACVDAATQTTNSADAATFSATATLAPVVEYVAPASAVTDTVLIPVIEYVALVPAFVEATPATVAEHVAPAPADANAATI